MKYLLIVLFTFLPTTSFAGGGKTCETDGKDCEVVKVLTRCDIAKYKLQEKIKKLQEELKQLESQKTVVEVEKIVEREVPVYVTQTKVVVKREVKTKIKKHIISLYAHRTVTSSSTSSGRSGNVVYASGELNIGYLPGLMYQYQFDMGLVPLIGLDTRLQPLFGLGYEF